MTQTGVNGLMTKLRRNKRVRRDVQGVLWCIAGLSAFQGVQRLSHASSASAPDFVLHPVPSVAQALPAEQPHTYRFRVLRPSDTQSEVKLSVVSWKQELGSQPQTHSATISARFDPNEADKIITVRIAPSSIRNAANPDRAFIGDVSNQFYIAQELLVDLHCSETDRSPAVGVMLRNPFTVAAIQYPQPGNAVSLPKLSIRRSDATTMEEDRLGNPVQPVHNAKIMTATDKQGNVVASLTVTLETLAPRNRINRSFLCLM